MNNIRNQYTPDYVSPPGETLLEVMEQEEMSRRMLTIDIELSLEQINQLIDGTLEMTRIIANRLEIVFGISAGFWMESERRYRESKADSMKSKS